MREQREYTYVYKRDNTYMHTSYQTEYTSDQTEKSIVTWGRSEGREGRGSFLES
jgi:hypothetical protein